MTDTVTVIISPVDNCNLACQYCIDPDQRSGRRMSFATLENSIIKVTDYSRRLGRKTKFIWHGGEPLLARMIFYEKIVELTRQLKQNGFEIKHAVQTNATLLTGSKIEFFVKNSFHLSFSLDGPAHLNDKTRVYRNGKTAFENAMRGILAYKAIVGHASVICVLSAANIEHVEELYEFYKSSGLMSQFNPWFFVPTSDARLQISPTQYQEAIIKLFHLWFYDIDQQSWGENNTLEEYLSISLRGVSTSCVFRENCQNDEFYSIDPFGEVGPCSRFFGVPEFSFGNINRINVFDEVAESPQRRLLQGRNKILNGCNSCDYQKMCNSGCMHHSYSRFGTVFREDPLCSAYQAVFSEVTKTINQALEFAQEEVTHD